MRVRLIFRLNNKGAILPFHHQKLVHSFFQEILGINRSLGDQLACFSGVKGQTKISREGLSYFSRRVTVVFSSSDHELVERMITELFKHNHIMLGNLILEPEYVEEEIPPSFDEGSKFLCISPIVIKNIDDNQSNKQFIHPSTDQFSDLLYHSVMLHMKRSGFYSAQELSSYYKFQIMPDLDYLDRLNRNDKKFARIYTLVVNGDLKEVRGYTFPFTLYAAPEVQSYVFFNGLGELSFHGFGMVDLAQNELVKRNIIHQRSLPETEEVHEPELVTVPRSPMGRG